MNLKILIDFSFRLLAELSVLFPLGFKYFDFYIYCFRLLAELSVLFLVIKVFDKLEEDNGFRLLAELSVLFLYQITP